MSQPPYPGQGSGYPSGGGPGYGPGFPPPGQGFGPPPRRGRPWWVWALFGCGGCALLAAILVAVLSFSAFNAFQSVSKQVGPVNQASIQQSLGEVPLYPGSTLDTSTTQSTLVTYRLLETNLMHRKPGSVFRAVAAQQTSDSADKVVKFYDQKLEAAGWKKSQTTATGFAEQRQYRKGNEMLIIQAQPAGPQTVIMIIRGGSDLAEGMRRQQQSPSAVPAPQPR